jgi:hypothetical protein
MRVAEMIAKDLVSAALAICQDGDDRRSSGKSPSTAVFGRGGGPGFLGVFLRFDMIISSGDAPRWA